MPSPNNSQRPVAWRYSGDQMKRRRTKADVSREQLASAANYSPDTIESMERGVRRPTPRVLDVADELCGAQGMLSAAKEFLDRERYSPRAQASWNARRKRPASGGTTSYDSDTNQRDRVEKPDGYAAAGIPVYLLIDRDDCSVVVFNQPEDGRYRREEKLPFGATVKLPEPVNITLDTEPLKEFVD
ncbi:helix-turn-helix domain-containing protein [Streptomyces sp. NPDC049627]|uniref:helix-turn-helix domain-containing protein n=1 Tax=Streptomyces sp. NPDC049627 TaxID=3365595 RepID=UPI0037B907DC